MLRDGRAGNAEVFVLVLEVLGAVLVAGTTGAGGVVACPVPSELTDEDWFGVVSAGADGPPAGTTLWALAAVWALAEVKAFSAAPN